MLAYNGSIPGPTLKVQEDSEVVVNVENQGDMEATVHWHGLRLENRYDGTHETQRPMEVGEEFSARVTFPDPGLYWYHPHIREDYGQELGLYGNVLVEPADPDYWPPAHRELVLTLDDILLEDGKVAPFSRAETTHAAMGRFGDVLLVSGEPDLSLERSARRGRAALSDEHRQHPRLQGGAARGADEARRRRQRPRRARGVRRRRRRSLRRSAWWSTCCSTQAGELTLEHRTPERVYPLAAIKVSEERAEPSLEEQFEVLRTNADMVAERERIAALLNAEPDKTLAFIAEMDMGAPRGTGRSSTPARCTPRS